MTGVPLSGPSRLETSDARVLLHRRRPSLSLPRYRLHQAMQPCGWLRHRATTERRAIARTPWPRCSPPGAYFAFPVKNAITVGRRAPARRQMRSFWQPAPGDMSGPCRAARERPCCRPRGASDGFDSFSRHCRQAIFTTMSCSTPPACSRRSAALERCR